MPAGCPGSGGSRQEDAGLRGDRAGCPLRQARADAGGIRHRPGPVPGRALASGKLWGCSVPCGAALPRAEKQWLGQRAPCPPSLAAATGCGDRRCHHRFAPSLPSLLGLHSVISVEVFSNLNGSTML